MVSSFSASSRVSKRTLSPGVEARRRDRTTRRRRRSRTLPRRTWWPAGGGAEGTAPVPEAWWHQVPAEGAPPHLPRRTWRFYKQYEINLVKLAHKSNIIPSFNTRIIIASMPDQTYVTPTGKCMVRTAKLRGNPYDLVKGEIAPKKPKVTELFNP